MAAAVTAFLAARGTPMNPAARKGVLPAAALVALLKLIHLVWTCIGTYWTTTGRAALDGCAPASIRAAVVLAWFGLVVDALALLAAYSWVGGHRTDLHDLRAYRTSPDYIAANRSRLSALACVGCVDFDGDRDLVLADAAVLFSRMFQDADVVHSDILAGLKLTHAAHKDAAARARARDGVRPGGDRLRSHHFLPSAAELDVHSPRDADLVADLAYFGTYALAVYGWPLFAQTKLCVACSPLTVAACVCCDPCCADPYAYHEPMAPSPVSVGDNCCAYNLHAVRRFLTERLPPSTPADRVQILYSNYDNCVYQPNYLVAVDHAKCAIVISIRGTLSLDDVFTDVTAFAMPLDPDEWFVPPSSALAASVNFSQDTQTSGPPSRAGSDQDALDDFNDSSSIWSRSDSDNEASEQAEGVETAAPVRGCGEASPDDSLYAHVGMVRSAKWIRADLVSRGLLNSLRKQLQLGGAYAHFDVVVTGHSLGAGTAVLLACLLLYWCVPVA